MNLKDKKYLLLDLDGVCYGSHNGYPLDKVFGMISNRMTLFIKEKLNKKRKLLKNIHAELENDGCAILKKFLTQKAIKLITAEANKVSHLGHRSFNKTNPYFTKDDINLPKDDPRRQFYKRSNNFISADNFTKTSTLRKIFDFPYFDNF